MIAQYYVGVSPDEDAICHHGVLGMKWGHRKERSSSGYAAHYTRTLKHNKKVYRNAKKAYRLEKARLREMKNDPNVSRKQLKLAKQKVRLAKSDMKIAKDELLYGKSYKPQPRQEAYKVSSDDWSNIVADARKRLPKDASDFDVMNAAIEELERRRY